MTSLKKSEGRRPGLWKKGDTCETRGGDFVEVISLDWDGDGSIFVADHADSSTYELTDHGTEGDYDDPDGDSQVSNKDLRVPELPKINAWVLATWSDKRIVSTTVHFSEVEPLPGQTVTEIDIEIPE